MFENQENNSPINLDISNEEKLMWLGGDKMNACQSFQNRHPIPKPELPSVIMHFAEKIRRVRQYTNVGAVPVDPDEETKRMQAALIRDQVLEAIQPAK